MGSGMYPTAWRSIEVYVTEGSVTDKVVVRHLGLERAASIVVVADACTSDSPLLMDRRVLLSTSVLARESGARPSTPRNGNATRVLLLEHVLCYLKLRLKMRLDCVLHPWL